MGETTLGFSSDYGPGQNCAGTNGIDRVYSVAVQPGEELVASITPSVDLSLSVGTSAACTNAARVCLAGDDSGGATAVNSVRVPNHGATPLTLFLFVDSYSSSIVGSFDLSVAVVPIPPGEVCQSAIPLPTDGGAVTANTLGATNDYGPGTNCVATAGRDLVFSVEVPPGQRLSATLVPGTDLSLSVGTAAACVSSGRVCLAGDDSGGTYATQSVAVSNPGSGPMPLFLFVDAMQASVGGHFSLFSEVGPIAPGDVCATAPQLPTDGGVLHLDTSGAVNDYQAGANCPGGAGPDLSLAVLVPAGHRLEVTASPASGQYNPSLALVTGPPTSCATPRACAAQEDSAGPGAPEVLRWTNAAAGDETVFVIVDSASATGAPVGVSAVTSTPPPGETCANAEPWAGPASFTTSGYSSEYNGGVGCGAVSTGGSGRDRVFSFLVPAGQRLTTTVVPQGWDASLSLVSATQCSFGAVACLGGASGGGFGASQSATYSNASTTDALVFLIIDGVHSSAGGGFSLDAAFTQAPVPAPAGETCGVAPTLLDGAVVTATTAGLANDYASGFGGSCEGLAGPDGVYRVTLEPMTRLTATVVGLGGFDPSINLVASIAQCTSTLDCVDGDDSGSANAVNTVRWANPGSTAHDVFVVIDSSTASAGAFELTVTTQSLPPFVAAGDTCATAPPLSLGVPVTSTTAQLQSDYTTSASCVGGSWADGVFSMVVPPLQQLTVHAVPLGAQDVSLDVVAGPATSCAVAPRVCLASSNSATAGGAETVRWVNGLSTQAEVFVVVDSQWGEGPFTLTPSVAPLLAGEVCGNATAIAPGVLSGQSTTGYSNQLAPVTSCTGYGAGGPDRVYAITVPDLQRLTVSVTPTGSGDPAIYLVRGPGAACTSAPTCLDGDDSGAASATNTATWVNQTGGPAEVFVVIDSAAGAVPSFTLTTSIGAP
ncbi:MAG: hypothetical protein IAE78_30375 [Myxococcus sp.]|nr:hypothetical protein [Myxococcus sp.]